MSPAVVEFGDTSPNSSSSAKENSAPSSGKPGRKRAYTKKARSSSIKSFKLEQDEDDADFKTTKKSVGSSILRACGRNMDKRKTQSEPEAVKKETSEGSSSSDSDNEEEDVYTVERIDDKKTFKDGITYYFIKWKGWDESANTWEPIENLDGCAEILEAFENRVKSRQRKRSTASRQRKQDDAPAESQDNIQTHTIWSTWPSDKEPLGVEGVIKVDSEITYIVRRKTRLLTPKLDRSNTILVNGSSFRQSHPDMIIDFFQSRVVWAQDNGIGSEEQAEIARIMESQIKDRLEREKTEKDTASEVPEVGVSDKDDIMLVDDLDEDKQSSIMLGDPDELESDGLTEDGEDTEVSSNGEDESSLD